MPEKHKDLGSSPEQLDSKAEHVEETLVVEDQDVQEDQVLEESDEAQTADSSDAEDSKKSDDEHDTLLDVVKDVVDKESSKKKAEKLEEESEDDTEDDVDVEGKKSDDVSSTSEEKGKSEEEDDSFTEEELEKEKPRTRKRIKKLIGKLDNAHSEIDDLKPKAESYNKIEEFSKEYGITPEESAEAFTIMALVKTDPEKALERLQGHVQNISSRVGETLPEDLERKVQEGLLDEGSARELSRARAQAALEKERREAMEQQSKQVQQQTAVQQVQTEMSNALNSWQEEKQKTDPTYQTKHGFVSDRLRSLIAEHGVPRNGQEARQYAEAAYNYVSQMLPSAPVSPSENTVQNKKSPKQKRVISSRKTSGPSPDPKPRTTLDVIRQEVNRT